MDMRVLLVVVSIVLAGCSLPSSLGGEQTKSWDELELTVALSVETDASFSKHATELRKTLSYWETNAPEYVDHPITFRYAPNASDPDIHVRVLDTVKGCGVEDHTAGCAPLMSDLRKYERPFEVRIKDGFNRSATQLVLKHEFGHVLGLKHDDKPAAIMEGKATLARPAQRDAVDRPLPWNNSTLSVYVDERNISAADRPTVNGQIDAALDYYESGADNTVPTNISFVRVDDPAAADIRILFSENEVCRSDAVSCSRLFGPDPDSDGKREYYTQLPIYISDVEPDAVGWHTGRWLAAGLGLDTQDERPPPFQNAGYEKRRSDWWR